MDFWEWRNLLFLFLMVRVLEWWLWVLLWLRKRELVMIWIVIVMMIFFKMLWLRIRKSWRCRVKVGFFFWIFLFFLFIFKRVDYFRMNFVSVILMRLVMRLVFGIFRKINFERFVRCIWVLIDLLIVFSRMMLMYCNVYIERDIICRIVDLYL